MSHQCDYGCNCDMGDIREREESQYKPKRANTEVIKAPYIAAREALCDDKDPGGPGAYCKLEKGHKGDHDDDGYSWNNTSMEMAAIESQARVIARYQKELDKVRKEVDFFKATIQAIREEHAKDNQELIDRIHDLEKENSRLKELLYP